MAVHVFKLPDIGEGTAEAELVAWHIGAGDMVEEDQPIADVMTDKATVELTAPVSGKVLALHGEVGAMAQVGSPLVEFEVGALAEAAHADEAPAKAPPATPSANGESGIYVFNLPDIGEGTAEAELVGWHVQLGDTVEEDQPIADVMTDKATVELTAPVAGRISALHGDVGALVQVGSPLVEFATSGMGAAPSAEIASAIPAIVPPAPSPAVSDAGSEPVRPKASPAVRARAKRLGVPLDEVKGSGPHGRIRHPDLETWLAYHARPDQSEAASPPARPAATLQGVAPIAGAAFKEVKLAGLRRKIAEKMELSTRHIPHFAYIEEVDVTELELARAQLNDRFGKDRPKLTFLPFFIQALCRTLPGFAQINATYDEQTGTARHYTPVNIGIATQTDNGLIVPVLRDAQTLGLWELSAEIARLARATRDGTAKRDELSGSTITITSLGTLGGLATTPVINHPEVAIIGPNRIVERPAAHKGEIALRKMMNISSSFDHRVVDGHDAARFIQEIRVLLENPALLLAR